MSNSIIFMNWFALAFLNAQGASPEQVAKVPWWQMVSGIIAVLAGLVGLYYLVLQIKKIRLESEKLKQEEGEETGSRLDASNVVSVASEATIKNSKVGSIKGVQSKGGTPHNAEQGVNVFNKGRMENSVAGDIVGVEHQTPPREEES